MQRSTTILGGVAQHELKVIGERKALTFLFFPFLSQLGYALIGAVACA